MAIAEGSDRKGDCPQRCVGTSAIGVVPFLVAKTQKGCDACQRRSRGLQVGRAFRPNRGRLNRASTVEAPLLTNVDCPRSPGWGATLRQLQHDWGTHDRLVRAAAPPALDMNDFICRVIAVTRSRSPSPQVIRVLEALAADPMRWRYGYDLATEVHLKSGSLYPILIRLADREVLETSWEPGPPGRPPRHLYRLTPTGLEYAATLVVARAERSAPRRRLGLSGA